MSLLLRLISYIEPLANTFIGVVDTDPRTSPGLTAGIGATVTDKSGNTYNKTGTGDTAWTLVGDLQAQPLHGTGSPTNGGAGTGANVANPGRTYIDDATGQHWVNVNTLASPTWVAVQVQESST